MKPSKIQFLCFWVIGIFFCGCNLPVKNSVNSGQNIPSVKDLIRKSGKLYEAEMAQDWRTWYELTVWEKNGNASYGEFFRSFKGKDNHCISAKILSIKDYPYLISYYKAAAGAAVSIDVVYKTPLNYEYRPKDQTDYWAYIDGGWYWVWRGWPNG